MNNDNVIKSLS